MRPSLTAAVFHACPGGHAALQFPPVRSRPEIISLLTNPGIIAVVRTNTTEQIPPICEALLAGGVIAIEITFTVPNALNAIREASRRFGTNALIGAGTVLDATDCRAATDAGAQFVVSPVTKLEIVEAAHAAGKPVMLGAYTPTEAQTAYEAGADFIKIFPADKLGPSYIKALRAPLPHLKIVPTGGVDLNTAADFLRAGCAALGVGGSLLTAEILKTNNWPELTRLARAYVEIAEKARKK
jgi:2-dehydro-3-deoxyphosphogluconate aldolase/(4S)-4-hydroxy-2-oxoglutarate aldolase